MSGEFYSQVKNPKEILFGVYTQPFPRGPKIYLTPMALSFGWVGYAFTSLSAVGSSIVINCENGYTSTNQSWLLGRIIRDHELRFEKGPGPEAAKLRDNRNKQLAGYYPANILSIPFLIRIDIVDLEENLRAPAIYFIWVVGWATILLQLVISAIPWIQSGNWSIFFVTSSGTIFALSTGSLWQWSREKWPEHRLNRLDPNASPRTVAVNVDGMDEEKGPTSEKGAPGTQAAAKPHGRPKKKIVCLACGNSHKYVTILRGSESEPGLESLVTTTSDSFPETKWVVSGLALLWTILLVGVSGIETHTWFLLGIGALGMLQNIYAASVPRSGEYIGLTIIPYVTRPPIIDDAAVDAMTVDNPLIHDWLEPWETPGERGTLRELEKTIPKAGIALMPEYFLALWKIDSERYRDEREERFWRWMFKNPTLSDRRIGPA
ncbi:hypothetical protein F4782DRAFT_543140 [Xylaria castorea]|nr:hypothetical protein F4782DRAFT_543140 [Xylaria castorea]